MECHVRKHPLTAMPSTAAAEMPYLLNYATINQPSFGPNIVCCHFSSLVGRCGRVVDDSLAGLRLFFLSLGLLPESCDAIESV